MDAMLKDRPDRSQRLEPRATSATNAVNAFHTYDYAIIRVVPRVERGEFVNAGSIVSCPQRRFLEARIELDEQRLMALDSHVDIESVRAHLESITLICAGGTAAGPIGHLSQRERFHWLVAPKSALIQTSPVHTGRCGDPTTLLDHLMEVMVRPPRRLLETEEP
jgi:hypothetical protein